ncbi:DUF4190 domain-containing protein [Streptomonospora wellingtoniae]|uniref:DUF4190 domain-containing protein n=1 Tax=Streptomonospora wellingtoniae TaxID=3075544 RepID=A0ABU2L020_9ACTN|nr:DUF4190 domain-containing protein [Streptomonospora sp. DSM 45055]MDT0304613.1 DUF4190 domain-containing protein [Streptomonospora sp. DSM 45055]
MTDDQPEPRSDGQQPTVERGGLWGLFLSAAGLVLPPYGIVLSALGIFQGRRARRAARARNAAAPGALLSMVLGWVGVTLSGLMIIGYALVWDQYQAYSACSARALTHSSQEQCDQDFRRAVSEKTGVPMEQLPSVGG